MRFQPNVASISKPIAMHHYYCPSCGHEEQGLQHIMEPKIAGSLTVVMLTVQWNNDVVSMSELDALKKIDKCFEGKRPLEVKRMVSFRPKWHIGPIDGVTGYGFFDKAKELGLNIEIKDIE